MGTCSLLGQAVGTAAALAVRHGLNPREVGQTRLAELQQQLMDDDAYLPGLRRHVPDLSRTASLTASHGDPEPLRNGIDRPVGDDDNGWACPPGGRAEYTFETSRALRQARLVFDSDLSRTAKGTRADYPLAQPRLAPPPTLVKAFRIEAADGAGGWRTVVRVADNHQRLVRVPLGLEATALRLVPESTWGAPSCHILAWDVEPDPA
ncbi:MAG: FAD dependent oxidoreductase [Lentisphaerae bacterium ADurb.BinA184]|nr:MAG: FAD dependent oxidoreductase [Lentisphaerae bacterium ADurb.BinA184]